MTILVKWSRHKQHLHHLHTELAEFPAEAKSAFSLSEEKKKE